MNPAMGASVPARVKGTKWLRAEPHTDHLRNPIPPGTAGDKRDWNLLCTLCGGYSSGRLPIGVNRTLSINVTVGFLYGTGESDSLTCLDLIPGSSAPPVDAMAQ
jgi:hypothetical protein